MDPALRDVIFAHCRNPGTPHGWLQGCRKELKGARFFNYTVDVLEGGIKGNEQASEKTKELAAEGEQGYE